MRLIAFTAGWLVLAATFAIGPSSAGQGKGKGYAKGHDKGAPAPARYDGDRQVITQYLQGLPPSNLPPGLAKRGGSLPPGLEKQLQRNGTLPPGLAKQIQPLPVELETRLPPPPPDVRRGFVEGHVVIYNSRTSVVLDAFVPF
jgi:hypothetical protein